MKRRQFLQLAAGAAAGAMAEQSLAAGSWRPPYSVRVTEFAGLVVENGGPGEGIRVRDGERVRFHLLNATENEDVLLHLPGHRFTVVALDGNAVPTPAAVDVLGLAPQERIEAVVEMNTPGNWLLGSLDGLRLPISYENQTGAAEWHPPVAVDWSYARFSAPACPRHLPDELIEMLLEAPQGNHRWIVKGGHSTPVLGERLRIINATSEAHFVNLHPLRVELTRVNQIPVSGIIKSTIRLERYNVVEADVL
jgi:FtsP/CotA-like multicopper oxidase with cupredoxin domain